MNRFVSVFAFDGRIDDLSHNSELRYLGSTYTDGTPADIKFDQKVTFGLVAAIIRDNWELGRSIHERGYLVSHDFEGQFWVSEDGSVFGLNYLQKNAIDNLQNRINTLEPYQINARIDELLKKIRMNKYYEFQLKALKADNLVKLGKFQESNHIVKKLLTDYEGLNADDLVKKKIIQSRDKEQVDYSPYFNYDVGILHLISGVNFQFLQNTDAAKSSMLKAIEYWEKLSNYQVKDLFNAYNNLGTLEFQTNNLEAAFDYYEIGLKLSHQLKTEIQVLIHMNIASLHQRLEQFDLALDIVLEAEDIANLSNHDLIKIYTLKASILFHNNIEESKLLYQKVKEFLVRTDKHYTEIALILYYLILLDVISNDFDKTMEYYTEFLSLDDGLQDDIFMQRKKFLSSLLALYKIIDYENPIQNLVDLMESKKNSSVIRIHSAIFCLRLLFTKKLDTSFEINLNLKQIFEKIKIVAKDHNINQVLDLLEIYKEEKMIDLVKIEKIITTHLNYPMLTVQ